MDIEYLNDTKICNLCKQELSYDEYTINRTTKDGFSNRCKTCYNKVRREKAAKKKALKPNVPYVIPTHKICKGCKQDLSMDKFSKSKLTKDGREGKCITCRKARRISNASKVVPGSIVKKRCSKCKSFLDISNFSKDLSRDDSYNAICRKCASINHKKRYSVPEFKLRSKLKSKRWREENLKRAKKTSSEYYYTNREKITLKHKEYQGTDDGMFVRIKCKANARNIPFNLSKEYFFSIKDNNCEYCNTPPDHRARLDRIDSSLGYEENNVVPCCKVCNVMKNDLSLEDFYEHLYKIFIFEEFKNYEERTPEVKVGSNRKANWGQTKRGKYRSYLNNAKKKSKTFKLTYEEFCSFWQKHCEYCGSTIDTIGLDRYDNDKGYVISNIKPCCKTCNTMKYAYTYDEFIANAEAIIDYKHEKEDEQELENNDRDW